MALTPADRAALAAWMSVTAEDPDVVALVAALGPAAAWEHARGDDRWAAVTAGDAGVLGDRLLEQAAAVGATLLAPSDPHWPTWVGDLPVRPLGLWVTGDPALLATGPVALTGSRAATEYGNTVAGLLAADLAQVGVATTNGYGIDEAVLRGVLAGGGSPVLCTAAAPDGPHPTILAPLHRQAAERGVVVTETVPAATPTWARSRRAKQLLAALAGACVVVEASSRSGSMTFAAQAQAMARPLGAVPGPVTSVTSTGCHTLLKRGAALVTDAADVLTLAGRGR